MLVPLFTWSAVHAVLAAVTLFVVIGGGSVFWVLRHIHKRLRTLEEGNDDKQEALYGADRNPLHIGLTREVHDLKTEVEGIQEELDDADDERSNLKDRLHKVQRKLDHLQQQLEQLDD